MQQQVSLSEDAKVEYRTSRTHEIQVGGKVNKASFTILLTSPGPAHRIQITLLPTSSAELSIPPALLFTKDQRNR